MAATRTEQQQVTTTPLFEDQIRGYRRNQRRLYNAQQAARRVGQALTGGTSTRHTLEQQIEPEAQLQLSMQERASIVPAELLYHSRRDDAHHRVYVHRSEEAMLVTDNHQADRRFILEESFNQLRSNGMQYIHLGVLQVRIQILHRQREGTMALIVFQDNRWQGDQEILATMEVDLTHGSQMIYVIPKIMMTIGDFYRNIQIYILTRGYEAWQNSEANMLITRGLVGRLSNTPNVGFSYDIQGVVDYLTSHGVNALPGRSFSTNRLQGLNWTINPTQIAIPMQPAEDEEVYETLAVLIETQPGVYNNCDDAAEGCNHTERRKSKYKTGRWDTLGQPSGRFDYYVNYDIPTSSFNLELPPPTGWGDDEDNETIKASNPQEKDPRQDLQQIEETSSERIASRSGLAWKSGIEVGVGVIDSDFRGELIIEKIVMPEVYEVPHLSHTERGNKGFGSTDQLFSYQ
ncbi:hypothetical protein ZIOFF_073196 [Zingiber officinale]|uniref:dUTP diphosphatase n=1 Tax=Zingiber officinale TaxID=94328 RepID=A0A8J5EM87_ZINOF|nr:hypothetical protein ZIOFF_073196 [Zingiber officinale]